HLIMTTDQSLKALKRSPDAQDHLQLLERIEKENPLQIIYVTDLSAIEGDVASKARLAQKAASLSQLIQASELMQMKGEPALALKPPFEKIPVKSAPPTWDRTILAKDGVTRRMMLSYQDQWMMHPESAALFNTEAKDLLSIRGTFNLFEAEQALINFHRKGYFPTSEFAEVISVSSALDIKGKIVLIGDDLNQEAKKYIQTPFDRSVKGMTMTEMHANMIQTLIENSAPVKAPPWLNLFFTIIISILTVHVVLTWSPGRGILILVATAASFFLVGYLFFWWGGIVIEMIHPLITIFLCYYFFIPYRLIVENRKSWEYYQKHKLLSEVETLKTNFIGMMSHDLKTPLARIQGMTEIIAKDASPLSNPQREALDMIKQSSEDLLKFISTILHYAKIESQGIELHMESRDINEILKEVIRKHDFLAKLKHIQIKAELEPLFSIKVDPELMKKVLSNLVENAIKYSPENSKILITSEEVDNKVVLQVSDQGMGIDPEDLPNIFMKFFRSKNAKSSPVKGSGLGLYLAKYFVELHGGSISVESALGQGTTFTVELPFNQ
ncbi:MAG: ATP-binding protein, partial [Pseudobdellovibrionaceae bacterium]